MKKKRYIYQKIMQQGITAWEFVIERRSCSFSCSATLFCSLETIFMCFIFSLSLSLFFYDRFLAFFLSFNLIYINSAEFCGHLKEGDIWSHVFSSHMTVPVYSEKYYIDFGWTYKCTLPFTPILICRLAFFSLCASIPF